jgi:hypothetical protein
VYLLALYMNRVSDKKLPSKGGVPGHLVVAVAAHAQGR